MDPALLEMCDTPVSFKPRGPAGMEGQVTYGTPTAPVEGRIDWTKATRSPGQRNEPTSPSGTIFLDGGDFDPLQVPAGSLVVLPDGQEQAVNTVQPLYDPDDSTVVDHWELSF